MPDNLYVVTGAAGGIGRAVVDAILSADASAFVLALDVNFTSAPQWPDRVVRVVSSLDSAEAIEEEIRNAAARGLTLAGLVNCAGVHRVAPSISMSADDFDLVMGVNLRSSFFACQAAARIMSQGAGGAIVNLSSVTMHYGTPGRIAYGASKAAIGSITKTLAVEWAPLGIRVNAIAPGYIETDMVRQAIANGAYDLDSVVEMHPIGRLGRPDEIARIAVFLLSEDAGFVSGETINVDGGMMAKRV